VTSSDLLPAETEGVEAAASQQVEEAGEDSLLSEPAAPTEATSPVAELPHEPPQADIDDVAEGFPPPPPPPPPPTYAAHHVASYAAVAAAAAAARAAFVEPADEADWEAIPELDSEEAEAFDDFAVDAGAPPTAEVVPEAEEPLLRPDDADDLKRIRAIDRDLELRLNTAGVHRYSDIANWTAEDVASMSETLGVPDRIEQENWIEQASILAGGTDFAPRPRVPEAVSAVGMAAAAANAAASAAAQQNAAPDRFTRIIGIDADTEQALYDMGFSRYSEIAQWTPVDVEVVEGILDRPGRIGLDNWIEQARVLARYAGEAVAPRPVKLVDAIRENKGKSAQPDAARDMAGLRSVRSEALRGDMPSSSDRADDLKRIRGIGVLIEKRLNALGITSYEQVANWTKTDIDIISSQLDFRGRIERENWIEQARILASGGQTEFSRRVDRGDVETSKDS
jgi:predicted flap endonuclease-1-like 5' DNA nuclease